MAENLEVGEILELKLSTITRDGNGVSWGPKGQLILIEGVDVEDGIVKVEITKILEETIFATKIKRVKKEDPSDKVSKSSTSPYEVDDDEGEYEDDDEEYDDD